MTRPKLRISTLFLLLLSAVAAFAQSRIPVTGHFGGVDASTPNNFAVRFELAYCGSNLPRVPGVFNPVLTNATFNVDPTTGLISGMIWPNDELTCGGASGGTRYNVTAIVNNVPQGQPTCYQVLSSVGTFNLDTAQPCVQVPPPPPPPGFGDYEFNNLTLAGWLHGTSAIFTGDVTSLSFHFSTSGTHFACPTGQFANALNQDFTFACAAPAAAPVTSVFGRTGVVAAANGDYNFSQISGTLADSQFQATTHVYPIRVQEADALTNNPSETTCALVAGQAIASVAIDASANITCTHVAFPTQQIEAMTFPACAAAAGTYETCVISAVTWPTPFTGPYSLTCTPEDAAAQPGAASNESGIIYVANVTGSTYDVIVQNNRGSFTFTPTAIRCTGISHP